MKRTGFEELVREIDNVPTYRYPRTSDLKPILHYQGETYRQAPDRDMVVKGLLGSAELSVVYGHPKSGKSFLVTDLGLAVACGAERWFEHRIKRSGLVLYLVMEGSGGFPNRLRAWSQENGRPIPDTFVWSPERLQFLSGNAAYSSQDIQRIKALVEDLESRTGEPVILLVIDTLAWAIAGCDENQSRVMTEFIVACANLQELPSRPHLLVAHHHSPKSGLGMRGHSSLPAAANAYIEVSRTETGRTWKLESAKDDADGEAFGFALKFVELGVDGDGDHITSCVIEGSEQRIAKRELRKRKRGPNESLVYDALVKALDDYGGPAPVHREIPSQARVITMEQWEAKALELLPQSEIKRKHEAFRRAVEGLVGNREVHHLAGWAWL